MLSLINRTDAMLKIAVVFFALIAATGCNRVEYNYVPYEEFSRIESRSKANDALDKIEIGSTNYVFYFNSNDCYFYEDDDNTLSFEMKGKDYHAMIIYERSQVPIGKITDLIYRGMNKGLPGSTMSEDKYINVNGSVGKSCVISSVIEGVKWKILFYLFTGREGTVQVRVGATEEIFNTERAEIERFASGIAKKS